MIPRKPRRKKGANASSYASYRYLVMEHTKESKKRLGPQPYGHTLNHKIPIRKAFLIGIKAEDAGSLQNIEWTPAQKNLQDGSRITPSSIRAMRDMGYEKEAQIWEYNLETRI